MPEEQEEVKTGPPKELKQISETVWELPASFKTGMRVPARVIGTKGIIDAMDAGVYDQISNVATLPGIQKYALCMPDGHWGYGFPIGGVAAFDAEHGVISPGGIGFDINCGMRLVLTNLTYKDVKPKLKELVDRLFHKVPAGVGSKGFVKLKPNEFREVIELGAKWCISKGYGWEEDLERTEEFGCMEGADNKKVSDKAVSRGLEQIGTLGSGNHYLEIQRVLEENIFDKEIARKWGIFPDQIVVMFHCGSRGFGHQVATDYLKIFLEVMESKYGIKILDRELACAPFNSPEGQDYFSAMKCGINMSFANRQVILHRIREVFSEVFKQSPENLGLRQVYDVAHNTAKVEEYKIDGRTKKLVVHRKGATRSFGPGRDELPLVYRDTGQPVIIGGSMETGSYLLVGTKKAEEETFGSTCFTGETKIITDKGILRIEELHDKIKNNEYFFVPSLNEKTMKIEWKPIVDSMKRKSGVVEISISQRGKETLNRIRTTRDHNFITIENAEVTNKPVAELANENKSVCVADYLPTPLIRNVENELAYLVGAIVSDGSLYYDERHGKVTFIQKKIVEKMAFIEEVQRCFRTVFNQELREYKTKVGGGIIEGRQIEGSGTDYVCTQKVPALTLLNIYNHLNEWVLSLSEQGALYFLGGLIDGDGTYNQKRRILQVYTGDESVVGAALIACLKIGTVPFISKQRKSCFIIQISERHEELDNFTKRVKMSYQNRIYSTKLFAARQLYKDWKSTKWPFYHKAERNNLMGKETILKHIKRHPNSDAIKFLLNADFRMLRTSKIKEVGISDVYNITVEDNHNYIVLTDMYTPLLVKNCHGSGRTMSRNKAKRLWRGDQLQKDMEARGIYVKTMSFPGLAEEAGGSYKDIHEVAEATEKAGISRRVAALLPIGNVKG